MPCDPLRDLRAWQERLERLAAQHATAWAPPIDVYETEDRYVITAEVPGITREEVDLSLQDNRLTIRGMRSGTPPERDPRIDSRLSCTARSTASRDSPGTSAVMT